MTFPINQEHFYRNFNHNQITQIFKYQARLYYFIGTQINLQMSFPRWPESKHVETRAGAGETSDPGWEEISRSQHQFMTPQVTLSRPRLYKSTQHLINYFQQQYQKRLFFSRWMTRTHCYYFEYKIRPLGVTWCWSDTDWQCNETWRGRYKFLVTNQRQQFKQNERVEGSRLQYWSSQSVSHLMKLRANIDNNYDRRWGGRRLFGHLWT